MRLVPSFVGAGHIYCLLQLVVCKKLAADDFNISVQAAFCQSDHIVPLHLLFQNFTMSLYYYILVRVSSVFCSVIVRSSSATIGSMPICSGSINTASFHMGCSAQRCVQCFILLTLYHVASVSRRQVQNVTMFLKNVKII